MTNLIDQLKPNSYILRFCHLKDGFSALVIVLNSGRVFEFSSLEGLQAFIQAQVQASAVSPLTYPASDDPRR